MDSDSDWSEFESSRFDNNSRYIALTFDNSSPLAHHLLTCDHPLTCDEIHRSLAPHKSHLIPAEIFSEIFLYTIQADPRSQANLMCVCRHWHGIMLSTPGIHSQLRIYRWTRKKDVERFGRRWLLDVTVDIKPETSHDASDGFHLPTKPDFDPVEFHACFMAAADAASRWRSLALLSLPPLGEYKDLQIMHPLDRKSVV